MTGRRRHAHTACYPSNLEAGQKSCRTHVTPLAAHPSGIPGRTGLAAMGPRPHECGPLTPAHELALGLPAQGWPQCTADKLRVQHCELPTTTATKRPSYLQAPKQSPTFLVHSPPFPFASLSNYAPSATTKCTHQRFLFDSLRFLSALYTIPLNHSSSEKLSARNQHFWEGDGKGKRELFLLTELLSVHC